jgi:hypothetical protein
MSTTSANERLDDLIFQYLGVIATQEEQLASGLLGTSTFNKHTKAVEKLENRILNCGRNHLKHVLALLTHQSALVRLSAAGLALQMVTDQEENKMEQCIETLVNLSRRPSGDTIGLWAKMGLILIGTGEQRLSVSSSNEMILNRMNEQVRQAISREVENFHGVSR